MHHRKLHALWFTALLGFGVVAHGADLPEVASGRIERLADFPSKEIPPRNVDVWLPDGYPKSAPYAVLYMHDGQMLFDAATTWNHQEWKADEVAGELIASGRTRPFIIVGIWNGGDARAAEYFPQKPLQSLPAPQRDELLAMTYGAGQKLFSGPVYSDRYLRFLVGELKPYIDGHFATSPRREDTLTMGSSLGALISMYAVAEYPQVFGGAACLSTHWPGQIGDSPANPVPATIFAYIDRSFPKAGSHRIYFDHGTKTLDESYADRQLVVDAIMKAKGYTDAEFMSRVFAGAEHNETSWAQRLAIPMTFLLAPATSRAAK
ncbi:MAG TPA: alpha/beta hydrolase-fold protein [Dokdonella sp.]|jgi:enterochelin esterase-like enzyme|nr:alpha/beta hydrolase-fold protein [Dokdonella sp.]